MKKKRTDVNRPPSVNTNSKLHKGMLSADPRAQYLMDNAFHGSKRLCAAILKTGRTHGPMTEAQQIEAIEYAHDVEIGGEIVRRVINKPPRPLLGARWVNGEPIK
jgi:hypothetical protein